MDIIYKILFEVRLLHEFYLTNSDGATIFDELPADRTAFLMDRFARNERNITSDLSFRVPETARDLYRNYHLRLLNTYSGFKVAVQVKKVALAGPLIGFEPVVPLPADLSLPVLIMRKGMDMDSVTNTRMNRNIAASFYFSGDTLLGTKTHPFLTEAIPALDGGYTYEQGELALHGPADIRSFYIDDANATQWLNVTNGGYANEKDRFLVKPDFYYNFLAGDNVNDAVFKLKDHTASLVGTINAQKPSGNFTRVPLSFDVMKLNTIPQVPAGNKLLYTLEVTGNGGYSKTHKLVFLRDVATDLRNTWGLVNINNKPANAAFHLTDVNNRLITRLNPNNTVNTPPPLFDIWIKSRSPFWRYVNDQRRKLSLVPHAALMVESGDALVTLKPRTLSYTPVLLDGVNYRPNPKLFDMLKTEGRRLFADIMVPESEMFPLGP